MSRPSERAVPGPEVSAGPAGTEGQLGRNVRHGALWSAGSTLTMRLANVAVMAVIARLIAPDAFGVFALALTAHAFISSVAELGIAAAVARADLDIDRIAPTVTTIASLTSISLGALMATFAAPLAGMLGSAQAAGPLRVLAIAVALIGPFAVPGAQLQREFRQRRLFIANAVSFVPSTIVLFTLVGHGGGAMAFAWSRVVGQIVVGLVEVTGVSRAYRPGFSRREVRPLLAFGLPLAAANLLSQVVVNIDYVFVGRMLDVADVGLYTLAFNVAGWATSAMGSMLNGVVLPAFSRAKADQAQLEAAVRRAVRSVALIAAVICGMTAGLAHPLVLVLYGATWSGAAPVLSVLALYGAVSVLCLLCANITVAMGRTGRLLVVQIIALAVLAPALYLGIGRIGILGAGLVHVAVMLGVTAPAYLRALRRATGVPVGAVLRAATPPIVAGVLAAAAAHAATVLPVPDLLRLVVGAVAGVGLYGVLMARDAEDLVGARRVPAWARRFADATDPLRRWLVGRPEAARDRAVVEPAEAWDR